VDYGGVVMDRLARIACVAVIVFCGVGMTSWAGENEDAAVKAAESWLRLVDQGDYAESWKETASLFRSAVTEAKWEESMVGARKPLGSIRSRKLKSAQYATEIPGAPDGQYVVIQFDTSFSNKASAVETITPMKDTDGEWRVSGYFIK
jgi:hypothetical protein